MGHTKGPWQHGSTHGTYHGNPSSVYAPGGDSCVATVYGIWTNTDFATADKDPKCEVGMANARLICAAPDLLAALKGLIAVTTKPLPLPGEMDAAYAAARAAIARAEGTK